MSAQDAERLCVVYRVRGSEREARQRAEALCIEQTVEFPRDLLPARGFIAEQILGRLEALWPAATEPASACEVRVSYAVESAGVELTQLLNLAFGNSSLQPGIRLLRLELPDSLSSTFRGPRFGCRGLRDLLAVGSSRPLLATALKPMGRCAIELAELARELALGGVEVIKDDHGLADQPFCPFSERVARCAEAVAAVGHQTGRRCLYVPNVTAAPATLVERARKAKSYGAGGLLVAPGLCGFAAMQALADDDTLALPVLAHPAWLGAALVASDAGVDPYCLLGQITRLGGADAVIFPSYGGRFSFSEHDCRQVLLGAGELLGALRPILPAPAGGITLARLAELRRFYGDETLFLVGGDLHRGGDIRAACQRVRAMLE